MPRTSFGQVYRLRECEDAAKCVVCGTDDGQPALDVVIGIQLGDEKVVAAFPICSLVCTIAWTELIGRAETGDVTAMAMVVAYLSMAEHDV